MKRIHRSIQHTNLEEALSKWFARRLHARSQALLERRGGKMVIYANDAIGHAINASGLYELTELDAVFDFLRPLYTAFSGSVALDVGANIGNHSIYFSRYFSAVHAFEPHPVTRRILEINADLHPVIHVHPYGLGDASGTVSLQENPTNLGGSRIVQSASGGGYVIDVYRLDDLTFDASQIALVKIDVEGYEAQVLKGAESTMKAAQPIVLFEVHASDFQGAMEEVDILKDWGYRFA
ncbi:FkbM family methyltransferase [Thermosynechococcus sp. HY213]|uniref:FkbM family methyltransferase n=1 Tax=Thermosynechococcus sp. HY213 TaxID=3074104 RepID=UPI00285BD6DC|nr:FkbM family methyltransferase [Thermosynechococcus sp. HY213]MDR7921529.1 FkbM family methyltransferase [Thermosynechococcus sp. HY213]